MSEKPKLEYRHAYLSISGLVGMVVGCLILFAPQYCQNKNSIFHEIKYNPATLVKPHIEERICFYQGEIAKLEKQGAQVNANTPHTSTVPDTDKNESLKVQINSLKSKSDSLGKILKMYVAFRLKYKYLGDYDTIAFKTLDNALHLNIDPNKLAEWDLLFSKRGMSGLDVSYSIKDPKLPDFDSGDSTLMMKIEPAARNTDFMVKYPPVAVWVFCIMACMVFCGVVISYSVELQSTTASLFATMSDKISGKGKTEDNGESAERNKSLKKQSLISYWKITIVSFVLISGMTLIWYYCFNDAPVVKNIYFLRTFQFSMIIALAIGYFTGALCLAGFIQTSSMLSYLAVGFNRKVEDNNKNQNSLQKKVDLMKVYDEEYGKIFSGLLKCFNTYFVLVSIILSLTVLSSSNLFFAANSLAFVKMLASDWGYSPVPYDFVYLYGALNTGIMLLVYVPAKIKFDEFETTYYQSLNGSNGTTDQAVRKPDDTSKFLKLPYENFKNLLVVASPFLASLINAVFEMFFK